MSEEPTTNVASRLAPDSGLTASEDTAVTQAPVSSCIYCSGKNVIRRGTRQKKHEQVQLFQCKDCGRTFTGQCLKGKSFPLPVIQEAVSLYHLGYSQAVVTRTIERRFGLTPSETTLAAWLADLADLCPYRRLREHGLRLFSPRQVLYRQRQFHRQVYDYRLHRAKLELVLQEFRHAKLRPLSQYLTTGVAECPDQLFKEGTRASELRGVFDTSGLRVNARENMAVKVARFVLQAVSDNSLRHEALQRFMIANDSVTVATEVPVFLRPEDVSQLTTELGFAVPLTIERAITGHIDVLQVRNGAVHILDFKPGARNKKPIDQLMIYALALSRLTGLRRFDLRAAWFDEEAYYEFFPLHVVHEKKGRRQGKKAQTSSNPKAEGDTPAENPKIVLLKTKKEYRRATRGPLRTFRDLEVYQRTQDAASAIARLLAPVIAGKGYCFERQLVERALGIPATIARAHAQRFDDPLEAMSTLGQAQAACNEVIVFLEQVRDIFGDLVDRQLCTDLVTKYATARLKIHNLSNAWNRFLAERGGAAAGRSGGVAGEEALPPRPTPARPRGPR
jgi:hypothetical protein